MNLDIAFSDHHYEEQTLREFGEVIRTIRPACDDPETRFWTFLHFVSEHHPSILKVTLEPEIARRVAEVEQRIRLPAVTVRESSIRRNQKEEEA